MFNAVCIMGNGILAKNCCKYLSGMHDNIYVYDTNAGSSWYLRKQTESIARYIWCGKEEIFLNLLEQKGNVLIISAVNPFLIPDFITDDKRFLAINLHHAFLPLHPGRNAEAWSIYEEDDYSGITWHRITGVVDGGEIISRKKIMIDDTVTSWKLLRIQNDIAFNEFKLFADALLKNELVYTKQEYTEKRKVHYSYEKPNNGVFDINWTGRKMSAFLRAMDYGPAEVMGKGILEMDSGTMEIAKYSIEKTNEENRILNVVEYIQEGGTADLTITKGGLKIVLKLRDFGGLFADGECLGCF